MGRFWIALAALAVLVGCENIDDLNAAPRPIGEFSLAHNVVVAPNLVVGPASREVEKEAWIKAMEQAVDARFSRYDGDQHYHFGIALEGYVLAQPGLPVVLSPKSVLIFKLTVWDDATGTKLNEEPEQITVLESLDGDTIVGSGLTKTAEEQMETLSINAAKLIQRWITRKHAQEQWFKRTPETAALQAQEAAQAQQTAAQVPTATQTSATASATAAPADQQAVRAIN